MIHSLDHKIKRENRFITAKCIFKAPAGAFALRIPGGRPLVFHWRSFRAIKSTIGLSRDDAGSREVSADNYADELFRVF